MSKKVVRGWCFPICEARHLVQQLTGEIVSVRCHARVSTIRDEMAKWNDVGKPKRVTITVEVDDGEVKP